MSDVLTRAQHYHSLKKVAAEETALSRYTAMGDDSAQQAPRVTFDTVGQEVAGEPERFAKAKKAWKWIRDAATAKQLRGVDPRSIGLEQTIKEYERHMAPGANKWEPRAVVGLSSGVGVAAKAGQDPASFLSMISPDVPDDKRNEFIDEFWDKVRGLKAQEIFDAAREGASRGGGDYGEAVFDYTTHRAKGLKKPTAFYGTTVGVPLLAGTGYGGYRLIKSLGSPSEPASEVREIQE